MCFEFQQYFSHHPQGKTEETSQGEAGAQCSAGGTGAGGSAGDSGEAKGTPKRLHVSNIPFRFRDPDLRQMFGVSISERLGEGAHFTQDQ